MQIGLLQDRGDLFQSQKFGPNRSKHLVLCEDLYETYRNIPLARYESALSHSL